MDVTLFAVVTEKQASVSQVAERIDESTHTACFASYVRSTASQRALRMAGSIYHITLPISYRTPVVSFATERGPGQAQLEPRQLLTRKSRGIERVNTVQNQQRKRARGQTVDNSWAMSKPSGVWCSTTAVAAAILAAGINQSRVCCVACEHLHQAQ